MYCKLRIPYKRLNISYNQITANNPSIGFVTGHINTQQMQGRSGGRPGGGRRPGGGGKPGGGGGRPGGNSNSNPDMQAMQKATSFWLKGIKIATNK